MTFREYHEPEPLGWTPREQVSVYVGGVLKDQTHAEGPVQRVKMGVTSGKFLESPLHTAAMATISAKLERGQQASAKAKGKAVPIEESAVMRRRARLVDAIEASDEPLSLMGLQRLGLRCVQTRHDLDVLRKRGVIKSRVVTDPNRSGAFAQYLLASREWPPLGEGWTLIRGEV